MVVAVVGVVVDQRGDLAHNIVAGVVDAVSAIPDISDPTDNVAE